MLYMWKERSFCPDCPKRRRSDSRRHYHSKRRYICHSRSNFITIEDDIDLLLEEVQEEALGYIGKEVIVEEVEVGIEVEVGVVPAFLKIKK